ncbi:MAG: flagellar capping protein [Lachnospiraceae bacterium]|nr:flagellar capping protein [Lachnospiraceae bacterium]
MAYNSAIDNVYNHYLTTYAPKSAVNGKYDAHKKSELRGVYNSMLKLNKDTPLYILDTSDDARKFAVGIKEDARNLRNTLASLGGLQNSPIFDKKTAYSSNDDMVSAEFVGDIGDEDKAVSFDIEVTNLASKQVNLGYALRSNNITELKPDTYSFDLAINDMSYEFQFNVRNGDTNLDLQNRLSRLINNANIGVEADILQNGKGASALRITSVDEGLKNGKNNIFSVNENQSQLAKGAVEYLGIDYVSEKPSNAEFILNGELRTASSNHFMVEHTYELNLKGVRAFEGDSATIGMKADLDTVTDNVEKIINGYNSFVDTALKYQTDKAGGTRLISDLKRVVDYYQSSLEKLNIEVQDDGCLSMDNGALKKTLAADDDFSRVHGIQDFASSVLRKANQISLNPMEYVDKTIVAYKNPGKSFPTPYVGSNYSGMLFNSYC